MADDKLGKVVRIDDKKYDPKGAKLEVWTKGRNKYLIKYLDPKVVSSIDKITYINGNKISASLTDDEVIKEWLAEKEAAAKSNTSLQVYKVIQDPYSDSTITKRVYGDGKSPYYLNNGCSINIEWIGQKPNPNFILGTFSNPDDAEDYYIKGPDRFLRNTSKNPVILTSSVDDADDISKLPTSTWVVEKPFPMGVDVNSQPAMSEPNYRDKSYVWNKVVTVNLPKGFTENGGKGYLVWTYGGLQYDSKAIPEGSIDYDNYVGRPKDEIVYFKSGNKDSDIVQTVIQKFKEMVTKIQGIPYDSYDLKLCSPDSEACKLIDYKSPLEVPNNTPQQAAINDTPVGPSQSSTKIKLNIQGLFDSGDGTTPGKTASVFEIKAKTDMPTFTVWTGEIPKTEEIDIFEDLPELDSEYSESSFAGQEEKMAEITQLNSIDDEPAGPSFDSQLTNEVDKSAIGSGPVDKSVIGRGPVLGSKLTNKSGSSMINLAGHRLTPILKDLENYLNKNGYIGAKIGNNGVMRDLRGSAYPSSPARATASLHGAGLAIDVTFNIPGFKWSSIFDNGNLSKDSNLTRVIANFVKGQGDITWGASWGKGSKPSEGLVYARGITEYHHFEIRSDLIPSYWEPVKDELAKFGFKPTDLKSPGKGTGLHKLMLKLLGDA